MAIIFVLHLVAINRTVSPELDAPLVSYARYRLGLFSDQPRTLRLQNLRVLYERPQEGLEIQ
ncbi:MAG: hypothetical protein CL409_07355 [Acidimicrobiaceae bacterium]|nr:hypothetical protein [Acidimicrobiaceae bacterium]